MYGPSCTKFLLASDAARKKDVVQTILVFLFITFCLILVEYNLCVERIEYSDGVVGAYQAFLQSVVS